jgi:hypothetical protein
MRMQAQQRHAPGPLFKVAKGFSIVCCAALPRMHTCACAWGDNTIPTDGQHASDAA